MKIICIGYYPENLIRRLQQVYAQNFHYQPDMLDGPEFKNCEILITRYKNRLDHDFLSMFPKLKHIIQGSIGIDNIEIGMLEKDGIQLHHPLSASTDSVAEYTLLLLLGLFRNIRKTLVSSVNGRWIKDDYIGNEIKGKAIGIVGLGKIGSAISHLCGSFGMEIYAIDPFIEKSRFDQLGVKEIGSIRALLEVVDVVSLHVPYSIDTHHMIGNDFFEHIRRPVFIINTSRGMVIDEQALRKNIDNPKLLGVALDVFSSEPFESDDIILNNEKVLPSPHVAGTTTESFDRICNFIYDKLNYIFDGRS